MLLAWLFWSAGGFVVYAYLGYPLLLWAIATLKGRGVDAGPIVPRVTFVIAAHNEERRIREKIENTLALDYPPGRLQLIVASDCSTDGTDDIVRSCASRGVQLVRAAERKGKENAQRLAVEASSGEVIVFSDVATVLEPDGVRRIVQSFSDPTVGCVSSVDRFLEAGGTISGEGAYVRYEMLLRRLETRANSLVGLSGSFFAARREVCTPWAVDLPSDFNTLLNAVRRGLRGVLDPRSIGYYRNIADEKREYERKVRTVLRGITTLAENASLLNPLRHGMFSWQLFSHKLCRWLVPFALFAAFTASAALAGASPLYRVLFVLQAAWYAAGLFVLKTGFFARFGLLRLPAFFLAVNLSILSAWVRYARGERRAFWNPSER